MTDKGLDPHGIRAIMGDGIICGITVVDDNGDSISPYINYLDSRTQEDADSINALEAEIVPSTHVIGTRRSVDMMNVGGDLFSW